MSWDDVKDKIQLAGSTGTPTGVSGIVGGSTDVNYLNRVKSILEDLYQYSEVAALLNKLVGTATVLYIGTPPTGESGIGGAPPSLSWAALGIDESLIQNGRYFTDKGVLISDSLKLVVAHELVHALGPLPDPNNGVSSDAIQNAAPSYDYNGPAVDLQNKIAVHLGLEKQSNYYTGTSTTRSVYAALTEGISYSEGNTVNLVRYTLSDGADTTLDMSERPGTSSDILIAFEGNDVLYGGAGSDYLYGGAGRDTLYGGTGNDLLFGGDFNTIAANDGLDTADYSRLTSTAMATSGITLSADFTSATTYSGQRVLDVTNDGSGGADRLVSIERIVATEFVDTFKFDGQFDADLDLRIDAKGTSVAVHDVIDLSSAGRGFGVVETLATGLAVSAASGGTVLITNFFGDVIGSSHSDLILANAVTITGGGGADYLQGGATTTLILGGAGSDNIVVGTANADGGAGDDYYQGASVDGGFIIFGAGSGHDVINPTNMAKINIGSLGVGALSLAWEKTVIDTYTYIFELRDEGEEFTSTTYSGRLLLTLASGDTITIGTATANSNTGRLAGMIYRGEPNPTEWGDVRYDTNVEIHGAGGLISVYDILDALGLHDTNGYAPPPELASGSDFSALAQWESAYDGPSIPAIRTASAGDDDFFGTVLGTGVDYLGALAGVAVDLAFQGRQATGGSGSDRLVGIETLIGSNFNDVLTANSFASYSSLSGEGGDDHLIGRGLDDTLNGGLGDDTIEAAGGNDYAAGDDGDDWITGGDGNDFLDGGAGTDYLHGGSGDDTLHGGAGEDILIGGDGIDFVTYYDEDAGVQINLGLGTVTGTTWAETVDEIESVGGTEYADVIVGSSTENFLFGGGGDDAIEGAGGNDELYGENGDDVLQGGDGDDLLVGGDGFDQANYAGSSSSFTFTQNLDGTVTVTDGVGSEGIDILDGVESLYFADDDTWISVDSLFSSSKSGSPQTLPPGSFYDDLELPAARQPYFGSNGFGGGFGEASVFERVDGIDEFGLLTSLARTMPVSIGHEWIF